MKGILSSFIWRVFYHLLNEGYFIIFYMKGILSSFKWRVFYHLLYEGYFIIFYMKGILSFIKWRVFYHLLKEGYLSSFKIQSKLFDVSQSRDNFLLYFVFVVCVVVKKFRTNIDSSFAKFKKKFPDTRS